MKEQLRILFVEDRPVDAELEERQLRGAGLVFTSALVDTPPAFEDAIHQFRPHVIISDYNLAGVSGAVFLQLARQRCPETPFIFVSGTIGEERAVEALKSGATDYVLKDRLSSLPIRVRRALEEADERRKHESVEQQLRQAQKVEIIGRLAGGVAHDFNNLLTVIAGYTDLALERLPKTDPLREDLGEISNATRRASELTRQLLAFARKQIVVPRVIDLNVVVADAQKLLQRLIGEDIDFVAIAAPEPAKVKADSGQIEQVIMNLAVNARDAMPNGGRLTIETRNVQLDEAYAATHVGVQPGEYVMLAVDDTGTGMSAEVLDHLFEPFFTTKEPGLGTGLGLSTAYGAVQQSSGHIGVSSELGRGTTFKVYLPRVHEPVDSIRPQPPGRSLAGSEAILVVEDEKALRLLARRVLESYGYRVIEATDGLDAIELMRGYEGPIDLLVTDVVMPRMSGNELAAAVAALRPSVKVLYLSGYTSASIAHRGVLKAEVPFLEKPFTPTALATKVRDVLDTGRQAHAASNR